MKFFTHISQYFCLLAFGGALPLLADNQMQETGNTAPTPYYRYTFCGDHKEPMNIVAKFLPSDPVIVDAGAFDGKESCALASIWPQGYIHSFEPVTELYELTLKNTQSFSNISAYKLALGDRVGSLVMYLSQEKSWGNRVSMSSSLYPPKEHLKYSGTLFQGMETVNVTTLDAWAEQNQIDRVDMLWLDMQGYELPAMKAAPKVLSKVSVIITELEFVEAYAGQPQYHEVKSWLESQGFVLVGGNFSFPKHPQQWFGDGIFVRKELLK